MAIPDLLTWLDQAGCTITKVEGVPDHVLVKRGGFHAILPTTGPETPRAGPDPRAGGRPSVCYPFTLTDDDGTVLVTFPDFPGATYGRTRAEAIERACAFVADALVIYLALHLPLPPPSTTVMDQQAEVSMPPARGTTRGPAC